MSEPLFLSCDEQTLSEEDQALIDRLSLDVFSGPLKHCPSDYVLFRDRKGLALQQASKGGDGPVRVDFVTGAAAHRRQFGGSELIDKAIGGAKHRDLQVLDLTAGLGRDSLVLAQRGYRVKMVERSPIVAELLKDGLKRAEQDGAISEVLERLTLHEGDSRDFLEGLEPTDCPDVIYIDPMFPPSNKSALVKKDMRAFHQLVGADDDSGELLDLALNSAKYRVVVKRPRKSMPLAGREPVYSLEGKAVRFDIYSLRSLDKRIKGDE